MRRHPGPDRPRAVTTADALFAKVQQRVLGVLFGNADRSFYANEIIALVGSGTGAVQRELARLESSGLVTVTRVGNQKHYRANAEAPVFAELRALVLKTSGLAELLRAALVPFPTTSPTCAGGERLRDACPASPEDLADRRRG